MITRAELIAAGYRPEQIRSCPLNDSHEQCPCQMGGLRRPKDCGLSGQMNVSILIDIDPWRSVGPPTAILQGWEAG